MSIALYHPTHGYYMTRNPIGSSGDFITAPEISQMFGELLGAWCSEQWVSLDKPENINLVELGPGRGTLMSDLIRTINSIQPDFTKAVCIHLIEISEVLRKQQQSTLAKTTIPVDEIFWHVDLESLPNGPLIVIANEFFDALPIQQFQLTTNGWCERLVSMDESDFKITLGPPSLEFEEIIPREISSKAEAGDVFEVRPAAIAVAREIAKRISVNGGAALFIDYGHNVSATGDTFQAVYKHGKIDALRIPGSADLTAHVDFNAIKEAVGNLVDVHGPVNQGDFLKRLGITFRTLVLLKNPMERAAKDVVSAHNRLVGSNQMGNLFKVMALTVQDKKVPAGFIDPS